MDKLNKQQVCDSKKKHTELSAKYVIENSDKGLSQDYYKCTVCGHYHINTINKSVEKKRKNKNQNKLDRETYLAVRSKMNRKGYPKRKRRK